jgi:Rad3-related DNA helicase
LNPPLDVLAGAVATLTAGRGKPRPGQVALASAIDEAMRGRGAHIGEAPTGSGKSLAYLSVALWRAAVLGERTLVTTATHSLQSQVVEKDIPVNHPALTGGACGKVPQAQVDQGARSKGGVGTEQKRFR